ncbi:MAG: hypothetical protein MdMp014T_0189 [Treponematales bacterium]
MKLHAKTVLLGVSLAVNAAFLALFALSLSGDSGSLSFERREDSLTAAAVVSVPALEGKVVFGAVEITLKKGEEASVQFSGLLKGRQANWLLTPLYDHKVVKAEASSYGMTIKALEPGETLMQIIGEDGVRDVALVRVVE